MNAFLKNYLAGADVVQIARGLIGAELRVHQNGGTIACFRIVETEAYRHYGDAASHARKGYPTLRTAPMFGPSGHAYIYLCYGMHHLFNIVTNREGKADAVLIRGIQRIKGAIDMQRIHGPGRVGKTLGITSQMSRHNLSQPPLELTGPVNQFLTTIRSGPRIGIDYAGADALLPWRFWLPGD